MSTSEIISGSRDPENSLGWPLNMRPKVAAEYTGVSESTLAKLRMLHNRPNGPSFIKLSGCVVYRRCDLDAWMDRHVV
ncbi:putative DNA-binding transcriptional regulator AlpA [Sulfitobacter geojensis]|nr:putative DNA-binding transcriptional regulator AlpA [Sulfitobacter geojensis]